MHESVSSPAEIPFPRKRPYKCHEYRRERCRGWGGFPFRVLYLRKSGEAETHSLPTVVVDERAQLHGLLFVSNLGITRSHQRLHEVFPGGSLS